MYNTIHFAARCSESVLTLPDCLDKETFFQRRRSESSHLHHLADRGDELDQWRVGRGGDSGQEDDDDDDDDDPYGLDEGPYQMYDELGRTPPR